MKSLFLLAFFSLVLCVTSQDVNTEECRVVHQYFIGPGSERGTSETSFSSPQPIIRSGPAGKRGPIGERGEKGERGEAVTSILTREQQEKFKFDVIRKLTMGVTRIHHNSTNEIKASDCEPAGCYTRTIIYDIPMNDIVNLIGNSTYCRQYIKYQCQDSILLRRGDERGWWVARDGTRMNYWGGAHSRRSGFCACGETGTCRDGNYDCNCDSNTHEKLSDEGYLDDKDALPVTQLAFGDLGVNGGFDERGWHTLGPLECF